MPGGPDGRAALDLGVRISQMVRGVASRPPVRIWTAGWPAGADSAEDSPGAVIVRYDFGDMLLNFELRGQPMGTAGAGFRAVCYGTEGTLIMDAGGWSVHWNDGRTGAADDAGRAREAAWRVCDADAATGRLSAALWRAAGISYRLGRDVRFDPSTESCPDDPAANELLSAGHRRRYCFPEA
jgi:hypothetical protein